MQHCHTFYDIIHETLYLYFLFYILFFTVSHYEKNQRQHLKDITISPALRGIISVTKGQEAPAEMQQNRLQLTKTKSLCW